MTSLTKAIARKSNSPLPPSFGPDRGKRIVITLRPGNGKTGDECVPDLIELRPERSRRPELIAAIDVYRYAMRCRVNRGLLEKANKAKAKKAQAKQDRAWARELSKAKKEGQAS